jgi:hypothetical protein
MMSLTLLRGYTPFFFGHQEKYFADSASFGKLFPDEAV